ncbi:DNA-binding MarR family transcriptional regulator [Kribbella voronezhensis]|uniref:DNA-binding MarR family transcriptional regulator n=1 Tax=Kribbella voronezhensis TaxID=2512212 RepID=A0A4R7SYJ0_9ACTN|nr:MarR family transcriptional regulator [Kribbella voronezhensis]TDU83548.1 DNA-binding MarR family transcriptional regulator [Kribbella voronezhensis]
MEREDLGALLARLIRRIMEAERPLLEAHGLSMWGYSVLTRLADRPMETQQALAKSIGYDKSRLIALLDDLERDGLLTRQPDPSDRRARTVTLTAAGKSRLRAAKADIRAMEEDLLAPLTPTERRHLLTALPRLAQTPDH